MRKLLLLSLFFVFLAQKSNSQTAQPIFQAPNILPPSPTASALGQYGLVPVNMANGAINASISLYEFKTKNLIIPISLTYSSNGIRVDEIASVVGLGWTLNSGGVISRIIRDEPDELGFFDLRYPQQFNANDAETLNFIETAGSSEAADMEPDLYTFNFLGYSGKFVFDRSGEVVIMPSSNLHIQKILGYFIITTPDGIKFNFADTESSETTPQQDGKNYGPSITSWYLSKIEHPQGDVINFEYNYQHSYQYATGISQVITKFQSVKTCGGESQTCPPVSDVTQPNGLLVFGRHLSKIESPNYGKIEFSASLSRTDFDDYRLDGFQVRNSTDKIVKSCSFSYVFTSGRMFLAEVIEQDVAGSPARKHSLEYEQMNSLPARLSYSQDHWGYFNGASNTHLVPRDNFTKNNLGQYVFYGIGGDREPNSEFSDRGILRKIIYPTGGSSEFFYEPHTVFGDKKVYPTPTTFGLICSGSQNPPPESFPFTKSLDITSPIDQTVNLSFSVSLVGQTDPGTGGQLNISDLNSSFNFSMPLMAGQNYHNYFELLANHTYRISIVVNAPTIDGYCNFQYYQTAPTTIQDNVEIGGIRLAKVVNLDPISNKEEETSYHYAKHDLLTQSSGVTNGQPEYLTHYFTKNDCSVLGQQYTCNYVTLNSNNNNNLFKANGSDIFYRYVTITKGAEMANGYEEHEFIINFDQQAELKWGNSKVNGTNTTNSGYDHGKEKFVRYFKKSGNDFILIKEIFNSYVSDTRKFKEVPAVVVRKKYQPKFNTNAVVTCNSENINEVGYIFRCTTVHSHSLRTPFPWEEDHWYCMAFGAQNEYVQYWVHPCNALNKSPGDIVTLPHELNYLDVSEYGNKSYWVYMDKTIETTFDEAGLNPIVKEVKYFYDNPDHAEISRTTMMGSDGKEFETVLKYPDDYATAGNQMLVQLRDKYIVNVPIRQDLIVNGNQSGGTVILYNSNGQPNKVYQYESDQIKPPVVHDSLEIIPSDDYKLRTTLEYDVSTNNLTKIEPTSNLSKSYLWGYNGTLPVAELVNAVLEDSSEIVDVLLPLSGVSSVNSAVLANPVIIDYEQDVIIKIDMLGVNPPYQGSQTIDIVLEVKNVLAGSLTTRILTFDSFTSHRETTLHLQPGEYKITYKGLSHPLDPAYNFNGNISFKHFSKTANVFYTSFEEDVQVDSTEFKTGKVSREGPYTIALPKLAGNYLLTYWEKTTSGSWAYHEQFLSVTTGNEGDIIIGVQNSLLDEIRLFPVGSKMTTYTYDPLVGVTSVTDPNNITSYYEYDGIGRLSLIRDDKGNILKRYKYHYAQSSESGQGGQQ